MKELILEIYKDLQNCAQKRFLRSVLYFIFDRQFHMLAVYRVGRRLYKYSLGKKINVFLRYVMGVECSCELHFSAKIGMNISFPHPIGIVIGENVVIGDDVRIFQNVTIGSHGNKQKQSAYPLINNGVTIYANSTIIGGVKIGNNAVIGANSVVLSDVESCSTYAGVPAIKLQDNQLKMLPTNGQGIGN